MMNRNISSAVITGPTGAIGTALCMKLAQSGIEVYAVHRPDSLRSSSLPEHEKIHKIACDVSMLQQLPALIPGGADAFFHFAWMHTTGIGRNNMSAQIKNIQHTVDAVQVAAKLGCQVFIGAGSQAEYGRVEGVLKPETPCFPENGYGMAKYCAGLMSRIECERYGIHHIWARVLSVYGPNDNPVSLIPYIMLKLKAGEKPALTAGIQQWDYLYSFDAAIAFHLMAVHGIHGKTYVLGSGKARPLKEYILHIRDTINPQLPLGFGEIPYVPLQVMHLQADISALTQDTGFIPETAFEDGIRQTVEYFGGN